MCVRGELPEGGRREAARRQQATAVQTQRAGEGPRL